MSNLHHHHCQQLSGKQEALYAQGIAPQRIQIHPEGTLFAKKNQEMDVRVRYPEKMQQV